jgi:hypothetical protein
MSNSKKSSLEYLIREALQTGNWQLMDANGNAELWMREDERVKIGKKSLKGTTPPSYVFEVSEPGIKFRKTDFIVMNLLCTRLAKRKKMSSWYDSVSTTKGKPND